MSRVKRAWSSLFHKYILSSFIINIRRKMEKYKTIEILGEGSFGTVFLIEDHKGKKYALKKIQVDPFKTEEALLQIQLMAKFIHPNLVRVYESSRSENDERIEILMEYCEGGDLLTYFKKKNKHLNGEEILGIFRQIVKAFIAMNVKDVLHRDLKPDNILLKNDNTVKIADFGCARMVNNGEISKIDNLSLDKGTPIYSSPEQLQNLPYSAKCDVWSAGCVLYFLTYAHHPFMDETIQKTLDKIRERTMNKKIDLPEETQPAIKAILEKTLVYEDKMRSSWRELWLSRFFNKKVDDVASFISYQWSICNIANWIVKQFWKVKKTVEVSQQKNQIFAYFIIKFQYTFINMANEIIKKHSKHQYLFNHNTYKKFKQENHKEMIKEITSDLAPRQKFFRSIKEKLLSKPSFKIIKEKERRSENQKQEVQYPFADLENSIRATYRLLKEIIPKLNNGVSEISVRNSDSSTMNSTQTYGEQEINPVWLVMAKWINFQFWFSYEKRPRIEDFLKESNRSILKEINRQIEKYRYGVVE